MIAVIATVVLGGTSLLLFGFGLNLLYLTWRATRLESPVAPKAVAREEPLVCVQLPIYDERYVAERVLDAACAIDWPRDRLEVQVLDDSDDETVALVARRVAHWKRKGVNVTHVRRGSRAGFKAGALAHGFAMTSAPFFAIFDADFVPPADFLRRTMGAFSNPRIAFAQARWGHLDEGYSLFTRLQAMAIDFHFLIEQSVRCAMGCFTNFTGTAGVWRREAIEDAGGWSARTLTEDLDLSYRAQLRGWKAAYIEDLVVPEELPVSIDAYRAQQSRWATGSFQSALLLLGPVLRSRNSAAVKLQAVQHLLAYGVGPVMLMQLACYPLFVLGSGQLSPGMRWYATASSGIAIFIGVAPWFGFMVAQTRRGRKWWHGVPSLLCQVIGAGMSLNTLLALFGALRRGGVFIRTPKHHITHTGQEWRDHAYVRSGDLRAAGEVAIGVAALAAMSFALASRQPLIAVYSAMFALGFLLVSGLSATESIEVLAFRRIHGRWRQRLATLILFGAAASLLAVAAQVPEPFEDGYGHWLIAAHLASTGHLHDPLFGMQDTWLPGYHVLAAAVLHSFGLWQIGALKLLSAVTALGTAACVYALAPNVRQGRTAVALLVLNPVFLFTSGSAVVEPMLTMLLVATGLAAVRGRWKLAALLAALACVTSTKAWIWVAAATVFALVESLRSGRALRARVAWAVPAIAVLVFLQLGFAPATHSVARGSVEVLSATGRGSIPAGAGARLLELARTYGLAVLPLAGFAAAGAARVFARPSAVRRFVYVPAAAYLGVVFLLIAAGAYTGSHRYLYLALPALALLAAAALDRYAAPVRIAAVATSALLAVGFLPVFVSFAANNSGLIAAGRAASTTAGVVLTDSPVVAYHSGKAPDQITGSQSLPLDRATAITWMRERGVTALVLEDISYYRATAVFPDLAAGRAGRPFTELGAESRYRVPGGKWMSAYRLVPALGLDPVTQGETASLAKGVTLGPLGTGEGMGFGVPIVRYADGWVYAQRATTTQISDHAWKRTFRLDTIGGDRARHYRFVQVEPRGEIEVTYAFDANGVSVVASPLWLAPGYLEVGILNEQSALFGDPGLGRWQPVNATSAQLSAPSLGLAWSVPALPGAQLYAGRESSGAEFNWAGLDYMFDVRFEGAAYHIDVKGAQ